MYPPTPPSTDLQSGTGRSLRAELVVSLLLCLALFGGTLAAFVTLEVIPAPAAVAGPVALVVGIGVAVAVPLSADRIGRLAASRSERGDDRRIARPEPPLQVSNRDRLEPGDRRRRPGTAGGRLEDPCGSVDRSSR